MLKLTLKGSWLYGNVSLHFGGINIKTLLPESKNFVISYFNGRTYKTNDDEICHEIMIYTNKTRKEVFDIISILPFWKVEDESKIVDMSYWIDEDMGKDEETPIVYKVGVIIDLEDGYILR